MKLTTWAKAVVA